MTLRIWFNRWFSTVAHYMDAIRNNPDGREVCIYGTHPNPETVYFQFCEVSEVEPDLTGPDYLDYCLDFCRRHKIDIFIPRKENAYLSQHVLAFEKMGVRMLVCPDGDLMGLLDHKQAMYQSVECQAELGNQVVELPAYRVVRDSEAFRQAYFDLKNAGHDVCIKPVVGEGATGFRRLSDEADTLSFLLESSSSQTLSFHSAYALFCQESHFPDLMVLEYLKGPEYSIDCLADRSGQLKVAVPRKKGSGRIRELEENHELMDLAEHIANTYKIPFIYNIQVKYQGDVPKLLEINPRMSGGLHISLLSGINFPYLAIKLLLGEDLGALPLIPKFGVKASYLEQPVVLN